MIECCESRNVTCLCALSEACHAQRPYPFVFSSGTHMVNISSKEHLPTQNTGQPATILMNNHDSHSMLCALVVTCTVYSCTVWGEVGYVPRALAEDQCQAIG